MNQVWAFVLPSLINHTVSTDVKYHERRRRQMPMAGSSKRTEQTGSPRTASSYRQDGTTDQVSYTEAVAQRYSTVNTRPRY